MPQDVLNIPMIFQVSSLTAADNGRLTGADITTASVRALNDEFRTALYNARTGGMSSAERKALSRLVGRAKGFIDFYGGRRPPHVSSSQWIPMRENILAGEELLGQEVAPDRGGEKPLDPLVIPRIFQVSSPEDAVGAGVSDALEPEVVYESEDEDTGNGGEISFYEQHKTAFWLGGGLVVLGVGAYLVWGR